jgi:hypothetical protein
MRKDNISLRGPAAVWCQDAAPDRAELDHIQPGGIIQSGVKMFHGVDSVWIRVHSIQRNMLDGIVIDGPGRSSTVRFRRRDVWRVI